MGKCGFLWRLNPIEWKRKSFLGTKYCIKREASPSTSIGRLGKWEMVLETYQQKSGQIWIIKSRAMIFQSFFINFLYAALCDVNCEQYNCLMEISQNFTFHENVSSPYFFTQVC